MTDCQRRNSEIPFTADQLADMAEMYSRVRSLRKVGRRFGININGVRDRLARQGVEILSFARKPALDEGVIDELLAKLDGGQKPCELAYEYGISQSTVCRYSRLKRQK